jgi:hypothetical protein
MKIVLIIVVLMATGYIVNAQEYNTNEKISDQLKKGTVQGLRFAPAKAARKAIAGKATENHSETIRTQLKNGTVPGMQVKAGGAAARSAMPANGNRSTVQHGALASDTEKPKTAKPATPVQPLPTQEHAPAKQ